MKKRILSLVLAILMIVSILPASTNAVDVSSKPVCNCPEGYDVTNGHVATCPLFTCPRCGKAGCYDGVNCQPETEPEKHPMLGKTVKLNPDAGSYNGYMAEPTWSQMLMGKASYPTIMVIGEVLEKDGVAYCRLSAVEGTWAFPEYEDKIYLEATKLIVVTWCDDCGKYDCGIDHGTTEPTDPSVPEGEVSKITGEVTDADGNVLTDKDGNPIVITVEGDLPAGAIVESGDLSKVADNSNVGIYDIKVKDANDNYWQPVSDKTVKVSLPVSADAEMANVYHFLEDPEIIKYVLEKGLAHKIDISFAVETEHYAVLEPAVKAYQEAFQTDDTYVVLEIFEDVPAENGYVTVQAHGFSVFVKDENGRYTLNKGSFGDLDGKTVYVRPGEWLEFDATIFIGNGFRIKEDNAKIVSIISEGSGWFFSSDTIYFYVSEEAVTNQSFVIQCTHLGLGNLGRSYNVTFVVAEDINYDPVYISVLPEGYTGYPGELMMHSAYDGIACQYWTTDGFTSTKKEYTTDLSSLIDREQIMNADLESDPQKMVFGVVDNTGKATVAYLSDNFNNTIIEQIKTAYCAANNLDKENYKVVVYVVKYEATGDNLGWYINCKVVLNDIFILDYDYNPPDGFFPVQHIGDVKKPEGQEVSTEDAVNGKIYATVDCDNLMVLTRKVTEGKQEKTYTATFAGWSTSKDNTIEFAYGATGQTIELRGNTTLYAVWTLSDNHEFVSADVTIEKVVKDSEGNQFDIGGVNFTYNSGTLKGKSYSIYNAFGIRQSTGTLDSTFVLQNGWYIVIENVGNGSYTVTESTPPTGYTAQNSPLTILVNSDTNKTGKLSFESVNIVNTYTVTWKNWDGTTLEVDRNVPHGATPEYNSAEPSRAATAQYSYNFIGWNSSVSPVTGDITYIAQFGSSTNNYTVTWKNEGGAVLEVDENVPYGTTPTYDGETPTKAPTVQYTYTFAGWSTVVAPVTGNVTYTATYTPALNSYTITFVNEDGTVLQSGKVDYGTKPVYTGKEPTKASTAQHDFTFAGWTPVVANVIGEATYTATYTETLRSYTVNFVNEDGTVLQSSQWNYGSTPVYSGATPTKAADNIYTYNFSKWSPNIASVTKEATYTATFSRAYINYSVTYKANTGVGSDVSVGSLHYGDKHTVKGEAIFTKVGYTFTGWNTKADGSGTAYAAGSEITIQANLTLYAQWKANQYTITFDTDGGNTIAPITQNYGTAITKPANPTKIGYTFDGWDVEIPSNMPAENMTITAKWTANNYTYNVVYKSSTGKDLGSATVTNTFGTTNTITAPAKAGYTTPSAQNVVWDSTSKTITFIYAPIEYTIHYVLTSNGVTGTNHAGNPATYTIESGLITLKDPTPPANYKFVGWKEGNTIAAGSTGEKTFTAQWELLVADYKVETHVMDTNGKYVLESTKPHSATIGSEVSVTAEPREGFSVAANSVLSGTVAANGTTTLKIYYSRNQYTVTYKVDGKVDGEVDTVYYGSNVVVRTEPTKEGYTFSGWKIGSAAAADFTMPADHVVIEGNWSVNSYTYTVEIYTMDTSGQYSKPDTKTFTANYNADVSFEPEAKTGFSVADASVLSGKVPANNDLVLAVYYARNTYTVTWIADGTEVEKAYLYGKTIEKPENPSKQGYNFAGWVGYTENMTMPAENRTFTADWDPRTDTPYKVIHKQQNVTGDGYTVVETLNLTGTTDAEITPAVNTYEGFVSPSAVTVTIKPDGSTVVEYKYDREVYSVTYVADGTTVHSESVRYQGNVVNVPAVPEKTGYTQTAPTWNHNGQNITADTEIKAQYTINQYTITATMANGSVTGKADSYQHGASASVKFTPNTGYKITGVTVDGVAQSNFTEESYVYTNDGMTDHVQIVVTTELKTFTVTWNVDGKVTTETYPYGQTPDFKGSTDKPADAQFTYTFSGWSPKVVAVTGDATYTATYRQTTNAYTITWVDGNGKVIGKNTMEYGTTPTYNGATPTKTATAQYTYTFKGWDKEIVSVTGNETYTALFDAVVNCYTITWKNDNGVILGTTSVAYGELPTYNGATPTKAADAQYTYTHNGWTPSVVEVTGEATYTATYSATVNEYTITFKNWDGTVLQTGKVPYGTVPVYAGATPIKAADNAYTYMWKGWDKTVAAVTGDAEYVAQFDATDRMYTITWKNWDGTELETDTAKYGEKVKYDGAAPSKAPDQQYWYHFEGWTGPNDETFNASDLVTVTGDAAYTAVLNPKLQQYMVTWIVEGVTMEQKEWEYGQTPSFSYGEPTKAEDNGYTYSFKGWTPVIVPVVDRVEYKAIFEATQKVFNIEYVVEENGVAGTVSGNPATYTIETPDFALNNPAPTLPYYHFAGWSGTGITGMSDAVVIAKGSYGNRAYQAHYALNQYTITFNTNGADQATLAAVTYKYGDAVVLPAVTKKGYTLVWKVEATSGNWKAGDVAVSGTWEKYGDIQLIAEWTPNTYTIKFAANGGTGTIADMTMTYDIAKQLTPNAFTRTGYHFVGWKDENGNTYTDAQTVINLAAANDGVVTLFAQWEINTVSLYINTHNAIDANQTYIYTVSGTAVDGRSIRLTVAMGANDSQKIVNLPAGNYTISDQPEWSWRYAGQTVVHDVHADVVVDFNYTYSEATVENHYWLNNYGVELLQVNTTKRKK